MKRSVFPLRFTHDKVRELVRQVAESEGISQNELLEQAAEHEVIARGALLAEELEASAAQLRSATTPAMAQLTKASMGEFLEGERLAEPLRPHKIEGQVAVRSAHIGAAAAFERS